MWNFQNTLHSLLRAILNSLIYSVSQKNPPYSFLAFFPNGLGIFCPNFTAYYTFLSALDYKCVFNINLITCNFDEVNAILSATTQFTSHAIGWNACWHFVTFSPNRLEFLVQILHVYYTFLSTCTLDYKFLFHYLRLWRSYAILSATT